MKIHSVRKGRTVRGNKMTHCQQILALFLDSTLSNRSWQFLVIAHRVIEKSVNIRDISQQCSATVRRKGILDIA